MNDMESNYGYIVADTPEKVQALGEKRSTDEDFISGAWLTVCFCRSCNGKHFKEGARYRRRVSLDDGWEMVPENGVIQERDEYHSALNPIGEWNLASNTIGLKVSEVIAKWPHFQAFRRRKPSSVIIKPEAMADTPNELKKVDTMAVRNDWVKFSERSPAQADAPIEAFNGEEIVRFSTAGTSDAWHTNWTHWRRADNTFPQPDKSPEDLAFEAFYEGNEIYFKQNHKEACRLTWNAAMSFKKGE